MTQEKISYFISLYMQLDEQQQETIDKMLYEAAKMRNDDSDSL